MTELLLIHGINNQNRSADWIGEHWRESLDRGLSQTFNRGVDDFDLRIWPCYYGDILHAETESWSTERKELAMSSRSQASEYTVPDVAALYREFQAKFGITDKDVAANLDASDDVRFVTMADGVHKKWIKAIARSIEKVSPTRGRFIAKVFLPQAAAYLAKPGLKERIDDIVAEQFHWPKPISAETIIISHSLGTVVAYSLLRRYRRELKVSGLFTMGSPLGIDIVQKRLGPPLVCLPNVGRWVNFSDVEDFVALMPTLDEKTFGCREIHNHADIDNGKDDAHSVSQYLRQPALSNELRAICSTV